MTREAGLAEPSDSSPQAGHPGVPVSSAVGPLARSAGVAAELAPFVAWLTALDISEPVRRSHRREVEDFLRWARSDPGPETNRRRRYTDFVAEHHPTRVDDARAGIDRLVEYHALVDSTLPIDQH